MGKEIRFRYLTVGELIETLGELPLEYQVVLYNLQFETRENAVTLEVFEDEEVVEIY